ncbi:hypothetical protein JD844_004560 [Phrynosoma platyrhinos]|uniref:DUF4456 domain-containing protein n=1 Tax=Phrynosoma platyrhinos TaxID=52577 RepID=A0ABQ7SDH4_PHRPL|nr:hypothetical protein JD844_004560 [Phrynosoma platyrhinos]
MENSLTKDSENQEDQRVDLAGDAEEEERQSVLEHKSEDQQARKEHVKEEYEIANAEESEKPGEMASESEGLGIPGEGASFILESDHLEKSDAESSSVQEAEDAAGHAAISLSFSLLDSTNPSMEFFTTSHGNTYRVFTFLRKSRIKKPEKYYAGRLKDCILPSYLEQAYLSESFLTDVRKQIRLQFFEHLEKWFADISSQASTTVAAKKEELQSELQLRIHLHEPRRGRIEKDIYHIRMAELRLHSERLVRHCAGVVEALNKERSAFFKLREDQNHLSKTFRHRIQDMENIFLTESRADKLVSLSNNLHIELLNHVEVMQLSLRSYRQYLEEALGKLREANTDFLKACRLFSNGGNFSPEELEVFIKRLQKESGRIDFVEGLIMIDMEKMESSYLEQATEVISKFENRFRYLTMDRVFMEKIQRFLTNIQVKIKSEVAKSNLQTQTLNSLLEKLVLRIDACIHPNVDKESVTPEGLYESTKFVMDELKKRSKYLDCLLLLSLEPVISIVQDPQTQTSFTVSIQSDFLLQESKMTIMGVECTALMNPSRMGKPAFDDAALSVVKHLTGFQRLRRMADSSQERERSQSIGGEGQVPSPPSGGVQADSIQGGQNVVPVPVKNTSSTQKYTKITRADRKLQIFGDKPKETDNDHFKGIIFNILWDNFDNLMAIAEDFYKKDKHQITRPEYLQETYDQCIDVLGQKLLMYQQQADEYHVACISEFRDQLKRFEEELPHVIRLVIGKHLKDHEQLLIESTEQIRRQLQSQLQKWDVAKDKTKAKLCPTLGHPHNLPLLEALCQEEAEREKDQVEGIRLCTKQLEACVIECAQKFVLALATCTEKVLMELDQSLTIDDVQMGKIENPREKTSTLIRRKKAGLSLEMEECRLLAQRGSR